MNERFIVATIVYVHMVSLALWCGGLFSYVVVVWPSIMSEADGAFPRSLLVTIGVRTAKWIYLAMMSAVLSVLALWLIAAAPPGRLVALGYSAALVGLVLNNIYGTFVAWPRIMFLPETAARKEWSWFRLRMTAALVVGFTLFSIAVIAIFSWRSV